MVENAIIMAGGEGVRLRPLTEERPKPLMPLLDEPVVGYTLDLMRRHGITRATLTLCYRAEQIRAALGDGERFGVRLRYVTEDTPRGTAGSVLDASRGMEGTVLVMSGDGLTDCDLTALWERHRHSGAEASLVLKRVDKPGDYGVCRLDDAGRITEFVEKPGDASPGNLVNTGIYFLERSVLDRIPADKPCDFGRELFPQMVAEGAFLSGLEMTGYWCDIGSRTAYAQAQMDLLMGRVGLAIRGRRVGRVIFAEGSALSPDVRVAGRCYVGARARVGRGTVLGAGTVLSQGAQVGANARLENTCLWENARIDGGTILKNLVVVPGKSNQSLQQLVPYSGESRPGQE